MPFGVDLVIQANGFPSVDLFSLHVSTNVMSQRRRLPDPQTELALSCLARPVCACISEPYMSTKYVYDVCLIFFVCRI